jgi:hypothetical protein
MLPWELSLFTYIKMKDCQFLLVDGKSSSISCTWHVVLIYTYGEEKGLRSFMVGSTPLVCTIGVAFFYLSAL